MQFHLGPLELTPRAPALDDAGVAQILKLSQFSVLMRSSSAQDAVRHSASSGSLSTASAAEEPDRSSLLEECHREHMARRGLEELFASGEMSAFEY